MAELPKIDIAFACVFFQRRLCWELSSLLQQRNPPQLTIDIAYQPNNGNPKTEEVIRLFKERGLVIRETVCGEEIKGQRGVVRDRQLEKSTADWILFGDCDHVYHPDFFNDLAQQLAGPLANETKCLATTRVSLAKDHCKDFFNSPTHPYQYPCIIENVVEACCNWPIYRMSPAMGAGYFQMANVHHLRANHSGRFTPPNRRFDRGWNTTSDKRFRAMLGGVRKIQTKPQYHLNHERPREEGLPDDIQR